MKNIYALVLITSFLGTANSLAMDSLDDNPAFLNTFFAERQEYLTQKNETRGTHAAKKSTEKSAMSEKNMIDSKWCDSKPHSNLSTNEGSINKNAFTLWVLSIMLATWIHAINN